MVKALYASTMLEDAPCLTLENWCATWQRCKQCPIKSYRNIYLDEPVVPLGWSNSRISIFSETPDFVVPVGEAPYNSSITNHVEYLPVTANLMAAKGCDGMLFSLIGDLFEAGILNEALAGRSGVTGGETLYRRGF